MATKVATEKATEKSTAKTKSFSDTITAPARDFVLAPGPHLQRSLSLTFSTVRPQVANELVRQVKELDTDGEVTVTLTVTVDVKAA